MPLRSKVAMLPAEVRNELERRIAERAFSGYQELAEWLRAQGHQIAYDSIQRHGSPLRQKIEAMERLAEEAKALSAAAADAGETIDAAAIQPIHQRVFSMLLEEPEHRRDGALHDNGSASLEIRDLARLTRIVADLNRITIARQRQAEEVRTRLEQQKHAARERREETEGGLSDEVYHAIRNTLLGINP